MTASAFIAEVEATYPVTFAAQAERVFVFGRSTLPWDLRQAILAHRDALWVLLRKGQDAMLHVEKSYEDMTDLGFQKLEHGKWAHPLGDDFGDRVLVGLIDPVPYVEAVRKEASALGVRPPEQTVEDLREVAPGQWRWVQRKGRYRDPFPRVTRL